MENAVSDEREAKDTLAEKNGELQRELSRCKDTIAEKDLTIENLKAESLKLEGDINNLKMESNNFNQANDSLKKEYADLQSKVEVEKSELYSKMKKLEADSDKRAADLKIENDNLSTRLQAGNTTAASLDEYKKRAQAALKKVSCITIITIMYF